MTLQNYYKGTKVEARIQPANRCLSNSRLRIPFSRLQLFSPPLWLTPVKLFHKTIPQAQLRLSNVQSVTVLVNETAHNSFRGPCEVFVNNKLRFSSNIPDGSWCAYRVYGSVSWECTLQSCICELFTQWIWVLIILLSLPKAWMEEKKIIAGKSNFRFLPLKKWNNMSGTRYSVE